MRLGVRHAEAEGGGILEYGVVEGRLFGVVKRSRGVNRVGKRKGGKRGRGEVGERGRGRLGLDRGRCGSRRRGEKGFWVCDAEMVGVRVKGHLVFRGREREV